VTSFQEAYLTFFTALQARITPLSRPTNAGDDGNRLQLVSWDDVPGHPAREIGDYHARISGVCDRTSVRDLSRFCVLWNCA
jgi:hypothetical protein